MFQKLALFQTAAAMAQHAGGRQAVVARNIANADTPGYQAHQIASFSDSYLGGGQMALRVTRPAHLGGPDQVAGMALHPGTSEPSPNGNTVSLEDEMLSSVAIAREHSRALAVYRHAMTVLQTTIGR